MLGEDLVFFRDKDEKVVALNDWCPHRGARLSLGVCEFPGTITCPYHGYTYDGTGVCVAGLIDSPTTPMVGKLRAPKYPTEERLGIVFVWMGETAPVPLEEDLPAEFFDSTLTGRRFMRVKVWESNWTEPMAQGIDFHEFYLHRGLNFWRLFNYRLPFFHPNTVYSGGVQIVETGPNFVNAKMQAPAFGQAFYPGLGAKWPRAVWWRRLRQNPSIRYGRAWLPYNHNVELPSKIRTILGNSIHLRWMVPLTEHDTRVWTFTLARKPKTLLGSLWQAAWYYLYRKPSIVIATNEKEDLVVFQRGRLNLERPQKLGPMDAGLIYFRRHLALQARDYQRLGRARGALKAPPVQQQASTPS
jgi:phenylpropionate dioxygenase-like ring-hydroxylating dioxygenase large terminal subunit